MRNSREYIPEIEYETFDLTENEKFHFHDKMEIFFVEKGGVKVKLVGERKEYEVFKGGYVVIKNAEYHGLHPMASCRLERVRFPVNFAAFFGKPFTYQSFVLPSHAVDEDELVSSLLRKLFETIKREINNSDDKRLCKSLCASLFTLLLSMYDKRNLISCISGKNITVTGNKKISYEMLSKFENILFYISKNYCDSSMSLSCIASMFKVNKTNLSNMFPKLTGQKFTEHVNELRINHAIELMSNTEMNVSEIAFASGFETTRSFNNVFKSLTSVTPSSYMASLNGKENGVSTEIDGIGKKLFNYKWKCTSGEGLSFEFLTEENCIKVVCKDVENRRWTHLRLIMIFFAGKRYKVTYKAKLLSDSRGNAPADVDVGCSIFFDDSITNNPYHHPDFFEKKELEDGWKECTAYFTIPEYYVHASKNGFSIFSNPSGNFGTNYLLKDVQMKSVESVNGEINE